MGFGDILIFILLGAMIVYTFWDDIFDR